MDVSDALRLRATLSGLHHVRAARWVDRGNLRGALDDFRCYAVDAGCSSLAAAEVAAAMVEEHLVTAARRRAMHAGLL